MATFVYDKKYDVLQAVFGEYLMKKLHDVGGTRWLNRFKYVWNGN